MDAASFDRWTFDEPGAEASTRFVRASRGGVISLHDFVGLVAIDDVAGCAWLNEPVPLDQHAHGEVVLAHASHFCFHHDGPERWQVVGVLDARWNSYELVLQSPEHYYHFYWTTTA